MANQLRQITEGTNNILLPTAITNITLPVAISMRTQPRLQMSAALPDLSELVITSGAMNAVHNTDCMLQWLTT